MSRRDSCTRQHPCPACGHPHRGKTAHCHWIDGRAGKRSGVWCANVSSLNGKTGTPRASGWVHWLEAAPAPAAYVPRAPAAPSEPKVDYSAHCKRWQTACTPEGPLAHLAGKLRLDAEPLSRFRVGWAIAEPAIDADGKPITVIEGTDTPARGEGVWTFPMTDGNLDAAPCGRVVSVRVRTVDGVKYSLRNVIDGSGLFIPTGVLAARRGLLLLPEGPTSASALCQLGYVAVGRPNNRAGVENLRRLIRCLRPRLTVVVGDNDERFNETLGRNEWPGREGALSIAALIACPGICVMMPPDGIKDSRKWLHEGAKHADVWRQIEFAINAWRRSA